MKGNKFLAILVMGLVFASCGKEEANSKAESAEAMATFITASDGVPVKEDLIFVEYNGNQYNGNQAQLRMRVDRNGSYMLYVTDGTINHDDMDDVRSSVTGNWRYENDQINFEGLGESIDLDYNINDYNFSLHGGNGIGFSQIDQSIIDTGLREGCLPLKFDKAVSLNISSVSTINYSSAITISGMNYMNFCNK